LNSHLASISLPIVQDLPILDSALHLEACRSLASLGLVMGAYCDPLHRESWLSATEDCLNWERSSPAAISITNVIIFAVITYY
jgi:hypothetical protein